MDLRRSSPPSSPTDLRFAIPAAREPLPLGGGALSGRESTALTGSVAGSTSVRARHCLNLAEGALVLVGAYMLIGAGIGEAAGSALVGVAAGLIAGVCAIAAILLITGSARAARDADPGRHEAPLFR
ncbi:MAG TPA: hypothetical protein VHX15_02840 [Frankiaceae bacterium]|nr:hypothetical protein [Frankiaceae bacterium]